MTAEQAIHSFWSSFDLTAYDENSVPDDAVLPYITYSVSYDSFDNNVSLTASAWDESYSWVRLTNIAHSIDQYIGNGGKILKTDNGGVWIRKNSPFYQRTGTEKDNVKRILFNVLAEYIQN